MKLKVIIKFVVIFLTFLYIVSCSKSQEESSLSVTSKFANDTDKEIFDESTLCDTYEFKSETESELSDSNVAFPLIMFSDRELSTEITTTDGTLHLHDGAESTLMEYSVSCLYGYLDKEKGVRRDITDNQFTYSISSNMEEDIITIEIFGESGYAAATYLYVKKALNEKGMPVFIIQKTSSGIGKTKS